MLLKTRGLAAALLLLSCEERRPSAGEEVPPSPARDAHVFEVSLEKFGAGGLSGSQAYGETGGMAGTLAWRGEVSVVDLEERDQQILRRLRFVREDSASLSLGAQEVQLPTFVGKPPIDFVVDSTGRIERVLFRESHDTIVQNVVQALLSHGLALNRPRFNGREYLTIERDLVGRSEVVWRHVGSETFTKETSRYLEVTNTSFTGSEVIIKGGFEFRYEDGTLSKASGTRDLRFVNGAAETGRETIEIMLEATGRVEAQPVEDDTQWIDAAFAREGEGVGVELGELKMTDAMEDSLNRQRAAGITTEDIVGYSAIFDTLGRQQKHLETYKRSVALVQLDASVVPELLAPARSSGVPAMRFVPRRINVWPT